MCIMPPFVWVLHVGNEHVVNMGEYTIVGIVMFTWVCTFLCLFWVFAYFQKLQDFT